VRRRTLRDNAQVTGRPGGQVPLPLSSFVGREAETAAVQRLLATERIVTLIGPGGTGKTRLALEAVRRLGPDPPGVCWIDLGPLTDPDLVAPRVAEALGVAGMPGEQIIFTVARHLANARLLLVLDTCEHLADAAVQLADHVLGTCPAVAMLATSREPLGLSGEITWPVPPLSVPVAATYDAVAASGAGALSLDRARAVDPAFQLTTDNAPALAEICRRLDGLPLAIELAAARIRALSPQRIARGLDDRFRLLSSTRGTTEPRHRTMLASIDWSHALLPAPERALLRAVGAFAGSFTLEGAAAVAGGSDAPSDNVLGLLISLVDRSLVVADTSLAEPRYRLFDTVRAFARDLLTYAGEADVVAERHFDHLASVARQHGPALLGPEAATALAALDHEIDDLRQALDWGVAAGDAARALELVSDLHWFWRVRGPAEGRSRAAAALDMQDMHSPLRGSALVTLSSLEMMLGDVVPATAHAAEAVDLAAELGDDVTRGRALAFLGWLSIMRERDLTTATAVLEDAVATCGRAGDIPYEALAHNALGFSIVGLPPGRTDARRHIERGIALGCDIGFERPVVEGRLWLAYLDWVAGDYSRAAERAERTLEAESWPWEPLFRAIAAAVLVECLISTGDYRRAADVVADAPSGGRNRAGTGRRRLPAPCPGDPALCPGRSRAGVARTRGGVRRAHHHLRARGCPLRGTAGPDRAPPGRPVDCDDACRALPDPGADLPLHPGDRPRAPGARPRPSGRG